MKTLGKIFLFVPLFAFLLLSCSESGDPANELVKEGDFKISELAGNWVASTASFNDGLSQSVEIIGEGGSLTMTVQSSGKFVMTITPVERAPYTVSGEMFFELWEGKYYFAIVWDKYPGDWDTYGHTWDGTTFSMFGGFESGEYDFDNDGTFESCGISIVFVKS